jgi:hypothetical protein
MKTHGLLKHRITKSVLREPRLVKPLLARTNAKPVGVNSHQTLTESVCPFTKQQITQHHSTQTYECNVIKGRSTRAA